MLRGGIVCAAAGLLTNPRLVIMQFVLGLMLVGLGAVRLNWERQP